MTITKYESNVKGKENPLTEIMIIAVGWSSDNKKDNYLVRTKFCKISELDDFLNRTNAAWCAACRWREQEPNVPIEFEISTIPVQMSKWKEISPYMQIKCGKRYYRINIPKEAYNLKEIEDRFGEFHSIRDIGGMVDSWLDGDYECSLWGSGEQDNLEETYTEEESVIEEDEMLITQETDLFVVSQSKIWSVDTGLCVCEDLKWDDGSSYVFVYKRCDYNDSTLTFEFTSGFILVVEYVNDEYGLANVECLQYSLIECIRTGWLQKLEKMYRDGRSNLPDLVFDHIMEVRGMSEERLQSMCERTPKNNMHYNSYGVQSSKCVETVEFGKYPARQKILSQDKVRDVVKLDEIVRNWNGKAIVSWKLDGCAVRLYYKGASLVRAESKGKARDVTDLMKNILSVPQKIYHGFPIMEDWFKDSEWFVTGELVAVNGRRSVPSGYLLRKDANSDETLAIANKLRFVVYDSNICEFKSKDPMIAPIRLYSQMLSFLGTEVGFDVVDFCEYRGSERLVDMSVNGDLPIPEDFDVDGLVVRLNDIKKYVSFGQTEHHPKGSVAFKFEDEWKQVTPDCIYGRRGINGVIKLIAEFRPLHFGDKVVKSAVWQPKEGGKYILKYNSSRKFGDYDVYVKDYTLPKGECEFKEYYNVDKIEVCLRGCVIPQWRLIQQ